MLPIDDHAVSHASRQHGAFGFEQLGGGPKWLVDQRVRSGRWVRKRIGVFVIAGSPDTWEQRLWLALLTAGPGSVVGRRAAARLYGLPGFTASDIDVVQPERTVTRAKPRTSRRSSRLPSAHVTSRAGFPVTIPARTVFDLAGLSSPRRIQRGWVYVPARRVERALDDALVRKMVTIRELVSVHLDLAGRGRPGTQLMRSLLEQRTEGFVPTESELEDLFVRLVERHGLARPRRQVVLGDGDGPIGRVDFLFESARLIVEVDGHRYHASHQVTHADHQRDLRLGAAGWHVIRLDWWQLVEDGPSVAERIRGILHPTTP